MEKLIIEIIEISKIIGIRFIIVEGYVKAYSFYEKNNFIPLKKHEKDIENIDKIKNTNPRHTFTLYQAIKQTS
jgi:hypothetical protein